MFNVKQCLNSVWTVSLAVVLSTCESQDCQTLRRNRKRDGDTAPDDDRTMQRACTEFEQFRLRNASDASTFRFPPDGGGDRRMRAAGADLPSPPADWIKIQTTFTPFLPADAPSAPSPADAPAVSAVAVAAKVVALETF